MAKSPNAFRTISEAAEAVGAPQHVLRFWETKFPFLAPVKRAGGRRFYRPQDVVLLKAIRRLLHDEGLTIRGVQRLHKEQGLTRLSSWGDPSTVFTLKLEPGDLAAAPVADPAVTSDDHRTRLRQALAGIDAARARLDAVLNG